MSQKPSVGRIVHLTGADGNPIAAIVTAVMPNGAIKAHPFIPNENDITWDECQEPGQAGWSWPPRA
ncbi:hypothetical protein [Pseudarthrobacter sp. PS3-L1]|uniref:hypothetical protein n=1 Tax=Pseudarthrobacter sp. PS3-L1 TaxID=3046207 RepID=UPI0024BB8256|nr:hypothetical protein [Pseudarthrobacter sp. PS3-L1]MDJ0321839.1 hypothetical protein [Pseudarthrobacter sp. PS3-L1]